MELTKNKKRVSQKAPSFLGGDKTNPGAMMWSLYLLTLSITMVLKDLLPGTKAEAVSCFETASALVHVVTLKAVLLSHPSDPYMGLCSQAALFLHGRYSACNIFYSLEC
jgi:hypothetical protein